MPPVCRAHRRTDRSRPRGRYDSFVNWEFFPSVDVPILVYFKETQTPEESWGVGPGEWANNDAAIAKGAVKGQVPLWSVCAYCSSRKCRTRALRTAGRLVCR